MQLSANAHRLVGRPLLVSILRTLTGIARFCASACRDAHAWRLARNPIANAVTLS